MSSLYARSGEVIEPMLSDQWFVSTEVPGVCFCTKQATRWVQQKDQNRFLTKVIAPISRF